MHNTLISVIVPIYNVEKYLPKCIESILKQTYTNIEIILVNDGSPDNSIDICMNYADRDTRIKIVEKKNGGLSDARNAGLKVATGEYVIFVDSDDFIDKNLIYDAYIKITESDSDICYFNYNQVDEQGNYLRRNILDLEDETYNLYEDNINNYLISRIFTYKHGVEAWNKLYRMQIIHDYKLTFIYNHEIFAEDLLFNLCYLAHTKKIATIPKGYYNYLIRPDSIMGKPKQNLFGRYLELFVRLESYWKKYSSNMNQSISLGYFIWLISTIKIKLKEDVRIDQIISEFKSVSRTLEFKRFRKDILEGRVIKDYINQSPKKLKHAILMYVIALMCLLRWEYMVVKLIQKLFT